MNKYALEIQNLSYAYEKDIFVLDDVSFKVAKGTYVSIIGHNGSGKSTLAKLIAGILDNRSEGKIFVFGQEVNNDSEQRPDIGIVFQNPDNQFIASSVRDDIAFGLENKQVKTEDMETIIIEYATKVGMVDYLDKEPTNLSGGQKQRVAIAGVLAMNPSILLLDEATAMLDPKGKREIKEFIITLREFNKDLTIISITHDIEETLTSDEIIVMNKGKIALQGKPNVIYENAELLTSIHLDLPFAFKLRHEAELAGISVNAETIEGIAEQLWP